jgi:hypothetical protein
MINEEEYRLSGSSVHRISQCPCSSSVFVMNAVISVFVMNAVIQNIVSSCHDRHYLVVIAIYLVS